MAPTLPRMETNAITDQILGAAMKIHSALGPGLLESVYRTCLHHELIRRGLRAEREKPIQIQYDGIILSAGLRIDLLVEETVLVEVKAVEKMVSLYESQLLTYLKLSGIRTGLLINFNVRHLRHGIQRMVR